MAAATDAAEGDADVAAAAPVVVEVVFVVLPTADDAFVVDETVKF